MRNIQEIFDVIIESNRYHATGFMCISLSVSRDIGFITEQEYAYAQNEIKEYMEHLWDDKRDHDKALVYILKMVNPETYGKFNGIIKHNECLKYCLPIYKDWANRPMVH